MASVGERLRKERESQGRELAQIAAQTRINASYLAAIEADDLTGLPGAFFARSFVLQYARALGLDAAEVETDLPELLTGVRTPHIPGQEPHRLGSDLPPVWSVKRPRPSNRRWLGALGLLMAVVIVCSAIYAAWMRSRDSRTLPGAEGGSERPSAMARTDAPASLRPEPAQPLVATADPGALAGESPADILAEGPLYFRIVANERTWVEVTAGGERLFTGTLEPGDTKNFSGLERARLLVGNAGGIEITSNAKLVGPIGPRGQVRFIVLTPDGAEIRAPRTPPSNDGSDAERNDSPAA